MTPRPNLTFEDYSFRSLLAAKPFIVCVSRIARTEVHVLAILLISCVTSIPTKGQTELAVVAGPNNSNFDIIDLSNPSNPTVTKVIPGFSGGTVVDCAGTQAVVGNQNSDQIVLFDISSPTNPIRLGALRTGLNGIGAIKFDRNWVLVGETSGFAPSRAVLIDVSNPSSPQILSTLLTHIDSIGSIALSGSRAVASGPNNMIVDVIDYSDPVHPIRSSFNPGRASALTIDLDGNLAAIGTQNTPSGEVLLVDITGPTIRGTANSTLGGVFSISIKGSQVAAGSSNNFNIALLDFTNPSNPTVSSINSNIGGGWVVYRTATHLAEGDITGNNLGFYSVSGTSSTLLANVHTDIGSIGSVCVSDVTPPRVVAPAAPNFGSVATNTSKTLALTFQNTGNSQLKLTNITTGGNPNFSATPSALTVGPNATGIVSVRFSPTTGGNFSGTLSASTNDPNNAAIALPLSGMSNPNQPPTIVIPATLDFGPVRAGTSLTKQLPIQNAGSTVLTISVTTSSHFASALQNFSINPGATTNVDITFTPDSVTSFTGTLSAITNDPANRNVTVALSGVGTSFGFRNPIALSTPFSLDYGQRPQLAASGSNVYVLWPPPVTGYPGPPGPLITVSHDGGATFNPAKTLQYAQPSYQFGAGFPRMAVESNHAGVIWDSGTPQANSPFSLAFSASSDNGTTFSNPITVGQPICNGGTGCAPPQVMASGSNVFVVWGDDGYSIPPGPNAGNRIRLASSVNYGQSFTSPVDVTDGRIAGFASNPRIAVSGNAVYVIWTTVNSPECNLGGLLINVGSVVTGQGVSVGNPVSLNEPPPPPPNQPCPPLTSDYAPYEQQITAQAGTFYTVWSAIISTSNRGVYFTEGSANSFGGVAFKAPTLIGSANSNAAAPQVAVDGSDVYIVWQDTTSGKILLSTSIDGGQHWNGGSTVPGPPVAISNTAGPSQAPQIVAAGGVGYIVWSDGTPGNACVRLVAATPTQNGPTIQSSLNLKTLSSFGSNSPQIVTSGSQIYVAWWDNGIWFDSSEPVSFTLTFPNGGSTASIDEGADVKATIAANLLSGFAQPILFSALPSSLPINAGQITFSPTSCIPAGTPATCSSQLDLPTSAATVPKTYNTVLNGSMASASVTASTIWTITVRDTVPPVVATVSATAPADGFLPSMPYTGSAVAWSPGQTVPTITIGTGSLDVQASATDNVSVASVSVNCSPSCGTASTVQAQLNAQGLWEAVLPITNLYTQLTLQATDPSGNIGSTYLNVQLNIDWDGDGIHNNVDGNCTTIPPTSEAFTISSRFGDCLLNGRTSGQITYEDPGIVLTVSQHSGGGVDVHATGPVSGRGVIQLDGVGPTKGPNNAIYIAGGASATIIDPARSTTIEVTKGRVEAHVGATTIVVIQAGQKVRLAPGTAPTGTDQVTLTSLRGTILIGDKPLTVSRSMTVSLGTHARRKGPR